MSTFGSVSAGTTIDKALVGLSNVDNTSDSSKPVSTAQATAIALKQALPVVQTATPTTASTVTINAATNVMCINPAGTLVALTISLPTASYDGQLLVIIFSQAVTTITLSGVSSLSALTTAALGLTRYLIYSSLLTKWC